MTTKQEEQVFILQATYEMIGDVPEVQLYCVTADDRRFCAVTTDFEPYFYIPEPRQAFVAHLRARKEVTGVERVVLTHQQEEAAYLKIYTRAPWDVRDLREMCANSGHEPFAADIVYGMRYLYDKGIGAFATLEGEMVDGAFVFEHIEPGKPFDPPLRIMGLDIEQSMINHRVLCVSLWMDENGECISGLERTISDNVGDRIRDLDPDVIVGYNLFGYDLEQLDKRMGGTNYWGRLVRDNDDHTGRKYNLRRRSPRNFDVRGRVLEDAWLSLRREASLPKSTIRPERQTLGVVGPYLGVGEKIELPGTIDEAWEASRDDVMTYCIQDSKLTVKVCEKLGTIDKAVALAGAAGVPLTQAAGNRSSVLVDSLLIREADRRGVAVPCMRYGADKGEKIKGGYVKNMPKGMVEYVGVLDFKSMYPSVIRAHNICFSTYVPPGEERSFGSLTVSPSGAKFEGKDEGGEGILPGALARLSRTREKAKSEYKRTKASYYNRLQDSVKVLMNSVYGVMSSDFYRFTNKDIGEAITSYARKYTKDTISAIEADGGKVLYGDTDSIFIETRETSTAAARGHIEALADIHSSEEMRLEAEAVYRRFISHGRKKRYAAYETWPSTKIHVRGYETRRGDAFILQKETLTAVFQHTLESGRPDDAATYCRDALQRLREGEVPLSNLAITRGVKEFTQYEEAQRMPGVRAAMEMLAMGKRWLPGEKVSWIVTADTSPQRVAAYWSDDQEIEPSYEYYRRRILSTVEPIMSIYGHDNQSLETGAKQQRLGDYGNS